MTAPAPKFLTAEWRDLVMLNYEVDPQVLTRRVAAGDFEEVNLRFYVRRKGPEGWRRGVVFVKELVPKWAIAWVARTIYNENYVSLPMRHRVVPPGTGDGLAEYGWRLNGSWYRLAARMQGAPSIPPAGSEEEFITEHYWGYALQGDGSSLEYQVEHPQWAVWAATEAAFEGDPGPLYGPEFAPFLTGPPVSAFVAVGSPIIVRKGVLAPGV
jgi:uncharacterized protein YqjF (DUF2071 family)